MATNAYIELKDSSGSGGYFAVVSGGYGPNEERNQTIDRTVGGTLDISQGKNFKVHEMLVRCREAEDRSGYGDYAELQRLWRLNNPKGSPSDKITYIDHYGTSHTAYFEGKFNPDAVTTLLEGENAIFFVPLKLHIDPS
jgi:hypothetical protein